MTAIGHLHDREFVHGALTPDSIHLKADGHVTLAYDCLGLDRPDDGKETIGNYAYTAPEMIDAQPLSKATDWYLLGLVLYEMLVGTPPFLAAIRSEMFDNILYGDLDFPDEVSDNAADLICKLLERDPSMRLGGLMGIDEIKGHPFFAGVNWNLADLQKQKMPALQADSKVALRATEKQAFEKILREGAVTRAPNKQSAAQQQKAAQMQQAISAAALLEEPRHWRFQAMFLQNDGKLKAFANFKDYAK